MKRKCPRCGSKNTAEVIIFTRDKGTGAVSIPPAPVTWGCDDCDYSWEPGKRRSEAAPPRPYAHYHGSLMIPVKYLIENGSEQVQEKIDDLVQGAAENMTAERAHTGVHSHWKLGHDPKTIKISITMTLE